MPWLSCRPAASFSERMSELFPPLPVDAILDDLTHVLGSSTRCVVQAPPGSGKTTRIPLALLSASWLDGRKILMLEPRRLATRAAARHMAGLLGEKAGQRIGYRTRLDMRVSRQTRVEVVTEGILTRMLQHDPELAGYGCVIFDEFHERNLQADLGLTLCLDVCNALRPDLRLVVMSATLDVDSVVTLLGGCPVLSCPGQPHPVETRYLASSDRYVEERMAKAIRHVLATDHGDILAFLPGGREIRRTLELLDNPGPAVTLHPLLGRLTAAEQDQALSPALPGTRKVVLATAIAETSLTIDGVRIVVDCGLARLPRFDPVSGMTRLVTEPASLATVAQRQGRAGRTRPGVCVRVWSQADEVNRKAFPLPEILEADLAPLVLELALWGVTDPAALTWLTPPPSSSFQGGQALLEKLGLIDEHGRLTAHGRETAQLPLHPRLGHMVLTAKEQGLGFTAACLAAILAEPGRSGRISPDLRDALAPKNSLPEPVALGQDQIMRLASIAPGQLHPESVGMLIALAYPDRVACRQGDGSYRLSSGRKAVWPGPNALADCPFLAVAELDGEASGARIWRAAPLSRTDLDRIFAKRMKWKEDVRFDPVRNRVVAARRLMLDELCLEEAPLDSDPAAVARVLLEAVREFSALPWNEESRGLRDRVRFLRTLEPEQWSDLSDEQLMQTLPDWLGPFVPGVRSMDGITASVLVLALQHRIGWSRMSALARLAPERVSVPSGANRRIDYSLDSGPVLPVKLQEMFGCSTTPTLAEGRYALVLHLLSPAGRPLQVTRDLMSFWKNGYPYVRAEMRGRYPKHPWPEDPTSAVPTAKTKKRSG